MLHVQGYGTGLAELRSRLVEPCIWRGGEQLAWTAAAAGAGRGTERDPTRPQLAAAAGV